MIRLKGGLKEKSCYLTIYVSTVREHCLKPSRLTVCTGYHLPRCSSFFFSLSFHFNFKFPPRRRCNTYSTQPFFSIPDLVSCYMLPEDMRSTARCSFHPATSLCLLAGIQQLILPRSHGGPFVSAPNLIIPANASITPP